MRDTQTSKQASKCSMHIICTILDAQISEYNKKLSTTPEAYDASQENKNSTPTARPLQSLHNNHPLSLVPPIYRNVAITEYNSSSYCYPQSQVSPILVHQPNIDETNEQILEKPRTSNFRSQNKIFLAHDEPPDWIPQPQFSYPSNLQQRSSRISISELTSSPLPHSLLNHNA